MLSFLRMPRKRIPSQRRPEYSEEAMALALMNVDKGISYGEAAKAYNVPKTTLLRRYKGKIRSPYKFEHKLALLRTEEFAIAQNLAALEDFGMAFSVHELQDYMKHYLDAKNGREVHVF